MAQNSLADEKAFDLLSVNPFIRFVDKIFNTSKEHHVPERALYDHSLLAVCEGELNLSYENMEISLRRGDFHIMPPLLRHKEYIKDGADCKYFVVHFDLNYNPRGKEWSVEEVYKRSEVHWAERMELDEQFMEEIQLEDKKTIGPILLHPHNSGVIIESLNNMYELYIKGKGKPSDVLFQLKIKSLFVNALANMLDNTIEIKDQYSAAVQRFILFVGEHYDEDLIMLDVLSSFGFTANHFRKIFKDVMKMTPQAYLAKYRIEKSKGLLTNKSLSIREIAEKVGYNDYLYFGKCFKRFTGVSPQEYRKKFFE